MYQDYLIQNEYDLFIELHLKIQYFLDQLIEVTDKKLNQNDKMYLTSIYKNVTNQAINTALCNNKLYDYFNIDNVTNKILPPIYIKPNSAYLTIIQELNKVKKVETLNKILEFIKTQEE